MQNTDDAALDVLPPEECRRLLTSVPIGRLAFTVGALPTVEPVHFGVRGDEVVIPARLNGKVEAASRGSVVAFEVDDYDAATRTGWSVTLVGPSRVLADAAEVAALHAAGLTSWAPAPEACIVAVRIARITGRRLSRPEPPRDGAAVPAAEVGGRSSAS